MTKLEAIARLNELLALAEQVRRREEWANLGSTLEEAADVSWKIDNLVKQEPLAQALDGVAQHFAKLGIDLSITNKLILAQHSAATRCQTIEDHNRFPKGRWS